MKLSGFSFVRNAVILDYPVIESIKSVLPIVDEFIIACGKSDDDTTELIRSVGNPKIKILETGWQPDDSLGEKIYEIQTDIALAECKGDWCIYLQADEVIHEKYLPVIVAAGEKYLNEPAVEGFLFHYIHFWGDYNHYHWTHHWYRREIRVVRNNIGVQSWCSAQGFRIAGRKMKVVQIPAEIYHYGWVRNPLKMTIKKQNFDRIQKGSGWVKKNYGDEITPFDYGTPRTLRVYTGTHPRVMTEKIAKKDWDWIPETQTVHKHDKLFVRFRSWIEENIFKTRIGEYRNYDYIGYDKSLAKFIGEDKLKFLKEAREK